MPGGTGSLHILWEECMAVVKNPPANAGDVGYIPGLGRSPGEGNGNPLQYSGLENRMERGTWWATIPGVAKRVGHDLVTKHQQQPRAKTPHSQYREPGFDLWSGS